MQSRSGWRSRVAYRPTKNLQVDTCWDRPVPFEWSVLLRALCCCRLLLVSCCFSVNWDYSHVLNCLTVSYRLSARKRRFWNLFSLISMHDVRVLPTFLDDTSNCRYFGQQKLRSCNFNDLPCTNFVHLTCSAQWFLLCTPLPFSGDIRQQGKKRGLLNGPWAFFPSGFYYIPLLFLSQRSI
jgi:hypothetical protein